MWNGSGSGCSKFEHQPLWQTVAGTANTPACGNRLFPGVVVRKDLVKAVKGNAIVPSYVLEYLLGQYAASDDDATIHAGIDTVRKILADHPRMPATVIAERIGWTRSMTV